MKGFAAVLGGLVFGLLAQSLTPASEDGDRMFSEARDAWSRQTCPPLVDYTIRIGALVGTGLRERQYIGTADTARALMHVDAFTSEEQRRPSVPRGMRLVADFRVSYSASRSALGAPAGGLQFDLRRDVHPVFGEALFGRPVLTPAYGFGLGRIAARVQASAPPAPGEPATIGRTRSAGDYRVEFAGTEPYGSGSANHLRLFPLRDPKRYRLRELWVDAVSSRPLQLVTQGNFIDGPPANVPWLITFQLEGGCTLVDQERALGALDYGSRGVFEQATIRFDIVDWPVKRAPVLFVDLPPKPDDLREPAP